MLKIFSDVEEEREVTNDTNPPPSSDCINPSFVLDTNRKPLFLTKSFQLHDICNYVSIGFYFYFKIKLWKLPIKLIFLLYWYIVENIFQFAWSFAKYS